MVRYPDSYYAPENLEWRKIYPDGSIMVESRMWGTLSVTLYRNREDYLAGRIYLTSRRGCQLHGRKRPDVRDRFEQNAAGEITETIHDGGSVTEFYYTNAEMYELGRWAVSRLYPADPKDPIVQVTA